MHDDAQKIKEQTNLKRGFFWAVTRHQRELIL
jgi:hypothetical protein